MRLLLLLLIIFYYLPIKAQELEVSFVNVGYADAILIETPDQKKILIDAGELPKQNRLLTFLENKKIQELDLVVLTHLDSNHINCLDDLKKVFKIKTIITSPMSEEILAKSPDYIIKALHPSIKIGHVNNDSSVLWLNFKQASMLLTADVDNQQLKSIFRKNKFIDKAQVFQIAHHGDFILNRFIKPNKFYIVSTGPNPYGAPNEQLLNSIGKNVYRTDLHGNIYLRTKGEEWNIETEREL